MKKIKIFERVFPDALEKDVNEFIAEHNVVDLQFQASRGMDHVMIVYEDEENGVNED